MSRKGTYQATKNRNTHRKQATRIGLYLRECSSESVMTTTSQGPKAAVINISSESRQELILAFQRGTTRAKRPNSGKRGYKSIFPHKMRLCPRAALRRSRAQDPRRRDCGCLFDPRGHFFAVFVSQPSRVGAVAVAVGS